MSCRLVFPKWSSDIRTIRIYKSLYQVPDILQLENEDAHYLGHVLRARPGQVVETFDGVGHSENWEITSIAKRNVSMRNLGTGKTTDRRAPVKLTLGLNPLKGGAEETAIRMATAMEVACLIPVFFTRSDVPDDPEKMMARFERWRKISISETAQSGGSWLPEIKDPVRFTDFMVDSGRVILLDEEADPDISVGPFDKGKVVTVLVGPEGGLERDEVRSAMERGFEVASLGPWTLRSELAGAIVPEWVYSNHRQDADDAEIPSAGCR